MSPVIRAEDLCVEFPVAGRFLRPRRWLTAVEGIGFALDRGEILGVVGESGCGKSTLGRVLLGLAPLSAGSVWVHGERMDLSSGRRLRQLRRQAQMVFQDPQASLDPKMTIGQSIAEPLDVFEPDLTATSRQDRVSEALDQVGLAASFADRYPHEFSGGQCQRIGIARAIVLRPSVIVCDEPVSALDVSVQGQVVNLLMRLRDELGLAYVFISHNLAVVRHVSTSVLVMYLGRTMEQAPRDAVYARPLHPYTRALLDAIPAPDPGAPAPAADIATELPSPLDPPAGCLYSTRCLRAIERCHVVRPELEEADPGHRVACHRWREWPEGLPGGGSDDAR